MAQRIAIALTRAREPEILIADEPTASLDAQVRDEILTLIEIGQRALRGEGIIIQSPE